MTAYWFFSFLVIASVGVMAMIGSDSRQRRKEAEEAERQRRAQIKEDQFLQKISALEEQVIDLRGELNGVIDSLEEDSFR